MRIPFEWLKEFLVIEMDPHELASKLTMRGLEVEAVAQHLEGLGPAEHRAHQGRGEGARRGGEEEGQGRPEQVRGSREGVLRRAERGRARRRPRQVPQGRDGPRVPEDLRRPTDGRGAVRSESFAQLPSVHLRGPPAGRQVGLSEREPAAVVIAMLDHGDQDLDHNNATIGLSSRHGLPA